MKVLITLLMRLCRLRFEAYCPTPEKLSTQSDTSSRTKQHGVVPKNGSCTSWVLDNTNLLPGWYMLEIEHSPESIGSLLELTAGYGLREYLTLTSKRECKRIVKLEAWTSRFEISIDEKDCTLNCVRLIWLTPSFANTRMRARLGNRSHAENVQGFSGRCLYEHYRTHIHSSVFPRTYKRGGSAMQVSQCTTDEHQRSLKTDVSLLLLVKSDNSDAFINQSLQGAIKHAGICGWNVETGLYEGAQWVSAKARNTSRRFIMPIACDLEYGLDSLHKLLSAINTSTILVYADHDHLDENGQYTNPELKPEWNPDLLLSRNYIGYPWIVDETWYTSVSSNFGNSGLEHEMNMLLLTACIGANAQRQSLDVCTEPVNAPSALKQENIVKPLCEQQVRRVPEVLVSIRKETALSQHSNSQSESWRRALKKVLSASGHQARTVDNNNKQTFQVLWPLPEIAPYVDIIIPTRDNIEILKACIESILTKTRYQNYRIIIVDNDSRVSDTLLYYESLADNQRVVLLKYPGAFNYSAINNHAVNESDAEIVVLLNNDTEVISDGWLNELVRQALRPEIGCVGAKLYFSNKRIQHGGVLVGINGVAGHAHRYSRGDAQGYCGRLQHPSNLSAVTAACLAVRRKTYLEAGGLDDVHLAVSWNDVDFCLKVKSQGYRNLWTPYAELFHHEGFSRGGDDTASKRKRTEKERQFMLQKWKLANATDPAYHPLLASDSESFALSDAISQPFDFSQPIMP